MDDRVQLKQQEVIGSGVMLNDINPKTNTKSVDDSSTGVPLDVTIDRIWQSVNNKLSRIVNSVNGRTGVVVLYPDDIGLGKVDNVSYDEIKQWVLNKLKEEFENKRIKLFDNMVEVEEFINDNDETKRDTPFYSHHGINDDKKAYIGYIYWDDGSNELKIMSKVIDTVGWTDNSLIYDENINNKDLSGGGLGVNIWKYEDALEVYNSITKSESGLRINKSKVRSNLLFFGSVYGVPSDYDEPALLYFENDTSTQQKAKVTIYIHYDSGIVEAIVEDVDLMADDLQLNDLILTNFSDSFYRKSDGTLMSGVNERLVCRQPCIGKVIVAPTTDFRLSHVKSEWYFEIHFYHIHPNVKWGLTHDPIQSHGDYHDTALSLELFKNNDAGNISGMNIVKYNTNDSSNEEYYTMFPEGSVGVRVNTNDKYGGSGLMITPNTSLCINPPNTEIKNYSSKQPHSYNSQYSWKCDDNSYLGVNLQKFVNKQVPNGNDKIYCSNVSGLVIDEYNSLMNDYVNYERIYTKMPYGLYRFTTGQYMDWSNSGIYQDTTYDSTTGLFTNVSDPQKIMVDINTGKSYIWNGMNYQIVNIKEGYLYDGKFYEDATHETEITLDKNTIYIDLHNVDSNDRNNVYDHYVIDVSRNHTKLSTINGYTNLTGQGSDHDYGTYSGGLKINPGEFIGIENNAMERDTERPDGAVYVRTARRYGLMNDGCNQLAIHIAGGIYPDTQLTDKGGMMNDFINEPKLSGLSFSPSGGLYVNVGKVFIQNPNSDDNGNSLVIRKHNTGLDILEKETNADERDPYDIGYLTIVHGDTLTIDQNNKLDVLTNNGIHSTYAGLSIKPFTDQGTTAGRQNLSGLSFSPVTKSVFVDTGVWFDKDNNDDYDENLIKQTHLSGLSTDGYLKINTGDGITINEKNELCLDNAFNNKTIRHLIIENSDGTGASYEYDPIGDINNQVDTIKLGPGLMLDWTDDIEAACKTINNLTNNISVFHAKEYTRLDTRFTYPPQTFYSLYKYITYIRRQTAESKFNLSTMQTIINNLNTALSVDQSGETNGWQQSFASIYQISKIISLLNDTEYEEAVSQYASELTDPDRHTLYLYLTSETSDKKSSTLDNTIAFYDEYSSKLEDGD